MRKTLLRGLCLIVGSASSLAQARLTNPTSGVVCDAYICADAMGISDSLTMTHLGAKKSQQLAAQGTFDRTAFTFANGVYCDTKEKVCRKDRYFGADGKPSGVIDKTTMQLLFAP